MQLFPDARRQWERVITTDKLRPINVLSESDFEITCPENERVFHVL